MNGLRLDRPLRHSLAGWPALMAVALLGTAAVLAPSGASAQGGQPPQTQTAPAATDSPAAATDATPPAADGAEAKAADQGPADQSKVIQLNGVTVQGKRNPLDEGDKHLKQLQDALPCNGCDAKPPTHKKLVKRVVDAVEERVLPTEAPDHSSRDANDKASEFSQENNCGAGNVGGCIPSNARP